VAPEPKEISLSCIPCVSDHCAWQALEGETVIVDLSHRKVMGLNPAGSLLWGHTNGQRTVAQLAAILATTYQLNETDALRDARAFFGDMASRKLVFLDGSSPEVGR
jgi:hypothetical protein